MIIKNHNAFVFVLVGVCVCFFDALCVCMVL